MVNIFIVEDHSIVRGGIRSIVEKEPEFKVVNEARSDEEAIRNFSQGTEAEILLVGLSQTAANSLNLLNHVKEHFANIKVIFLSQDEDEHYVSKAFKSGINGFLLKSVSPEEMIFAIKHISAGEKYICSELSMKLLDQLTNRSQTSKSPVDLSKRELEVLSLIAEGFTNNEIANKLFTSRRTVEGHRQNLLDKTNTRNTAALIRFAVKNGLV